MRYPCHEDADCPNKLKCQEDFNSKFCSGKLLFATYVNSNTVTVRLTVMPGIQMVRLLSSIKTSGAKLDSFKFTRNVFFKI